MGEVVVSFDHVSKRFPLNRSANRTFMDAFVRPFQRARPKEYFWPLREVSFEVEQGQSLGIIGENGTGKSTILKLIAHILEPTQGRVNSTGRISSLLELGASFHPELTGRENVFLAASIAGISRADINRQLAEVIAFADIGPYIDVAVKHYSSGMYVRLGFAVAAHMRPDILLVDEVLAVGDEAFQHKCLQTIARIQRQGVTIILVSHGLSQIAELCDRGLWLHEGYIRSIGKPEEVISDYLAASSAAEQTTQVAEWAQLTDTPEAQTSLEQPETVQRYERGAPSPDARRWGDEAIVIRDVRLLDGHDRPAATFQPGNPMHIEIDYVVQRPTDQYPAFGVALYRSDEMLCYGTNTAIEQQQLTPDPLPPAGTVIVQIPALHLLQGSYTLDVAVHAPDDHVTHDYIRAALHFAVQNPKGDQGIARQPLRWSLHANGEGLR
jgi:ABC-type polysaccharide/polyol phosphate transport system ATPase subunit